MAGLRARDGVLLVVDLQTGLLPAIDGRAGLARRCEALARAAHLLDVPVLATEHCPDKIGPTLPAVAGLVDRVVPKTHFDATREVGFISALPMGRPKVLVTGTEAHVCVWQTALGLKEAGLDPVLVADCVGSRRPSDRATALRRAAFHGIEVVTSEMVMFEWLESAGHPRFREVLALIKSTDD
ncbi:MAG TPA: isochorismatase family protein [Burkholderiaceae bacterium]|nr:isochorismatase family protein [Burkholderiaceae bacterium]